jgi:hypothetical protein
MENAIRFKSKGSAPAFPQMVDKCYVRACKDSSGTYTKVVRHDNLKRTWAREENE